MRSLTSKKENMNSIMDKTFYKKLFSSNSIVSHSLKLFSQFIGNWKWSGFDYDEEGKKTKTSGKWIFETVLNGTAIQDIFTFENPDYQKDENKFLEYGTTIRYPIENGNWKSVWIGPMNKVVRIFDAKQEGEEIVLKSKNEKGDLIQWIFYDITKRSFRWRGEKSSDNGKTWFLYEELIAKKKISKAN